MYSNDRGDGVLISEPVIGIVKNNIDLTHSGRIDVYVSNFGGAEPDNADNWIKGVRYLSPFFGVSSPNGDVYDGPDKTGYGKYVGNPHSYGFWASAPDIGTEVVCIFVDGKPNQGYYIGCVPKPGIHHMVPAVAAGATVIPNDEEASTYGGADRLPVAEVNFSNPSIRNSSLIYNEPKPVHSYQASVMAQQGLIRDNIRGTIGSSSQRETPSKVFGFSTPGGPIYSGGYTDKNIKQALEEDPSKLQIIGRRGGHSLVMDDGTIDGQDQLVRLRTSAGHQILMSDSGQTLFIIHSNGQSWIELGKEGTIDMFSTNSVNIRTQGDLNLHADRDINIHAKRNLSMFGENTRLEAEKQMTYRSGFGCTEYHAANYTVKVDGSMALSSGGTAGFASGTFTFINGKKINLNTGASPLTPAKVEEMTKISHIDTIFSQSKSWMNPSPEPLLSIASRVTAHQPYAGANKGVDVTVDAVAPSSLPTATPSVQAANTAAPSIPANPVSASAVATAAGTAPPIKVNNVPVVDSNTVGATMAQNAAAVATMTPSEQTKAGFVPGSAIGATIGQLGAAGPSSIFKPGAAEFMFQRAAQGYPWEKVASSVNFTASTGITSVGDLQNNTQAQISAVASTMQQAANGLAKAGAITGAEAATQITGVINAASQQGVNAVMSALKAPAQAISGITSAITSGNFAAAISDKVTAGIGGIANGIVGSVSGGIGALLGGVSSITGILGKIGITKTIAQLTAQLQNTARQAFATAEASFKPLTANKPNDLAGSEIVTGTPTDPIAKAMAERNQAEDEYKSAEKAYHEALLTYKANPTTENTDVVKTAQAAVAEANKKLAIASDTSKTLGNDTQTTTTANSTNSGVNGLPGGLSSLAALVSGRANNVVDYVRSVSSRIGGLSDSATALNQKLDDPKQFAGNLVGGLSTTLTNIAVGSIQTLANKYGPAINQISGIASKISSIANTPSTILGGINGLIGGIGGSIGAGIKKAVMAVDSYNKAAITAKSAQLLGDNRVPAPVFTDTNVTVTPNQYLAQQSKLQLQLTTLQAKRENVQSTYNIASQQYTETQTPSYLNIANSAKLEMDQIDAEIAGVQNALDSLFKTR